MSPSRKMLLSEFGERLRYARLDCDMTQDEVAQRAAISVQTLSRAESGSPMTTETLLRVLEVYGLEDKLIEMLPAKELTPFEALKIQKIEAKSTRRRVSRRVRV